MEEGLGTQVIKHLLSTIEIHSLPQYYFDMVRIGGGLYGYTGEKSIESLLREAITFTSSVSQITQIETGDRVSYKRNGEIFTASGVMDVAVADYGYVDVLRQQEGVRSAGRPN